MRVEAEGKELILKNKSGDYVIIPVKYRQEVLGMIKDGCHQCIDDLVATLPTSKDYAEDGTVISPEGDIMDYLFRNRNVKKSLKEEGKTRDKFMQTKAYEELLRTEFGLSNSKGDRLRVKEILSEKMNYLTDLKVTPESKKNKLADPDSAGQFDKQNKQITYKRNDSVDDILSIYRHERSHAEDIPSGIGNEFLKNLYDKYSEKGIIKPKEGYEITDDIDLEDELRRITTELFDKYYAGIPDIRYDYPYGYDHNKGGNPILYIRDENGKVIEINPENVEKLYPGVFNDPNNVIKEVKRWNQIKRNRSSNMHLLPSEMELFEGETLDFNDETKKYVGEDFTNWVYESRYHNSDKVKSLFDEYNSKEDDIRLRMMNSSNRTKHDDVGTYNENVYNRELLSEITKEFVEPRMRRRLEKYGDVELEDLDDLDRIMEQEKITNDMFYYYKPTEVKARLNSLREFAIKNGYKPGTKFPDRFLKKIKESSDRSTRMQYNDLIKYNKFTDEDIKQFMLLFADNSTVNSDMNVQKAAKGLVIKAGDPPGYQDWKKGLPKNLQKEDKDYDLRGAFKANLDPQFDLSDGSWHLGSRNPETGQILKSPNHPTYMKAIESDFKMGYYPRLDAKTGKMHTFNNEELYTRKMDSISKATTDRYRNLNWVQRGLKPNKYPVINNPDGSVSTHKLEYVEADGKFYVYPTIIQDEKGKLIELNSKDAVDYAFKTKTAIPFKTEAEAEYYSRNGLIKH